MIINHDLEFMILHIPKCAGKALRQAFEHLNQESKFWHWSYSGVDGRWIDMAHPTLDVLRNMPEWDLLERYAVIAVVRDPVARFFSAIKEHEAQHGRSVNLGELDEIRIQYDPRYIHFCPQHRFTHRGNKRKADFIARVENLRGDLIRIGVVAGLSKVYFEAVEAIPHLEYKKDVSCEYDMDVFSPRINRLYERDFGLFGYPRPPRESDDKNPEFDRLNEAFYGEIDWFGDRGGEPAYERFEIERTAHEAIKAESQLHGKIKKLESELAQCEETIKILEGRRRG